MTSDHCLLFPPFRFDLVNQQLWRDTQEIRLRRKTLVVLHYLVTHPGQLVTKEELLAAVWPNTYVSDVVPMVCIRELRKVLGDDARTPRFIQTVHRQGFRFIAPLAPTAQPVSRSTFHAPRSKSEPTPSPQSLTPNFVGREAELGQLHRWLEKALCGERQTVFVTGEPGIGKTALVEAFLARASTDPNVWIARGQCVEHYGGGEAYLPVLEALGRLCRETGDERLIELLRRYAPTWLVQMPWLLSDADLDTLQRKIQGATRERMLREIAEAVEALTVEIPLILALEDLHWSDYSTLDLLSFLAQRREPAQLLLIGTYRPMEVLISAHPLQSVKQELQIHGQCKELPLGFLTEAAVREYLVARFPENALPDELGRVLHQRTEGNPLFLVNVVDYLMVQGLITQVDGRWKLKVSLEEVRVGVPESLRQMIEKQITRLSREEQQVLEAASVAGVEFSAAAVAAGLKEEIVQIERGCTELARHGQFLRTSKVSEWPDRTVAGRYNFIHALYQNVLYERLTEGQRLQLHRRIGERQEQGYSNRAQEVAVELAMHFERGRDYRRAVQYLQQAAGNAMQRCAYREAIGHLSKGLELLKTLPDTPGRSQQELALQIDLGWALQMTKGLAAPEAERAFARAKELCQQIEDPSQLLRVLQGLGTIYQVRGELQTARELGEQCLSIARGVQDPVLLLSAHCSLGYTLLLRGELVSALAHLEQGFVLSDSQKHLPIQVVCLSFAASILWDVGYPDQALKRSQEALTLAQEQAHPYSLVFALYWASALHLTRYEWRAAQERAEATIACSTEQGFVQWAAMGTILCGAALAAQGQIEEGIVQMRRGLATYQATGAEAARPYYLAMLAGAYRKAGQIEEGLALVAEALATTRKREQCFGEAGLYRLKGGLLLKQASVGTDLKSAHTGEEKAEECFQKALDIARHQSAKSVELRVVMSLSRLWQKQGKKEEARQLLAEVYGWFTEGFDTADLQEARALLKELGG